MAARRKLGADFQASLAAKFDAIVFDKDGTLLDFAATWYPAIYAAIRAAAPTEEAAGKIASALGFDMESRTCAPDSPVIKSSMAELEALLDPHTDGRALLDSCGDLVLEHVKQMPAATGVLKALAEVGMPVAVATNDYEGPSRRQLHQLGWLDEPSPLIQAVLGSDSGHGGKPKPAILQAAAEALGVEPERCAMVGDAQPDLEAAARAGFGAAILIGPSREGSDKERKAAAAAAAARCMAMSAASGLALGPAARASDNPLAPLADFYIRDLDELLRPPNTRWL